MYRELHNIGRSGNLHVKMMHHGRDGDVGRLIVRIFCHFRFVNHDSADDRARPLAEWTQAEQTTFKRRFIEVCRDTWSRQWELLGFNSGSFIRVAGLGTPPSTVRLNVEISPMDAERNRPPSGAHIASVVVYRRNTLVRAGRANAPPGQNSMAVYANSVDETEDRSRLHLQRVAAHEFGHLLGFHHICGSFAGNQADDATYGSPGSEEARDIMGRGMAVAREHYEELLQPIASHLDSEREWSVGAIASRSSSRTARGPAGNRLPGNARGPVGRLA